MQLVILQDDRQIKVPLEDGKSLVLGRHSEADIRVNDTGISRKHLTIELKGDELHIRDLESRNGFLVRGKKKQDIILAHNDGFEIGKVEFIFQTKDDEAALAPPPTDDDATPMDADFVPISRIEETEAKEERKEAAALPAVRPAEKKGIITTGVSKQQPYKKQNNLVKMAIPGVAIFFILIIVGLTLTAPPEDPVDVDDTTPPRGGPTTVGPTTVGPSTVGVDKKAYKTICDKSIEAFGVYFKDPSGGASSLQEAIKLADKAAVHEDARRFKVHEDLKQIYSTFNSVSFEWQNFNKISLGSILNTASDIEDYRATKTSPTIKTFGSTLLTWAVNQHTNLKGINEVNELYITGSIESLTMAYKKCEPLKTGNHIYVDRAIEFQKRVGAALADKYFEKFREETDRGAKEKALRNAIPYNNKYQTDLDDFLKQGANSDEIEAQHKDLKSHVDNEEHKDVIEKAKKLFNTVHDSYARRVHAKSSKNILVRDMRKYYEKEMIEEMDDIAKNSDYYEDVIVQKLLNKYRRVYKLYKSANQKIKAENYEGAKQDFQDLEDLEPNGSSHYRVDAEKLLRTILTNDNIAKTHLTKGNKIFNNGKCALVLYKKARVDFDVAEKYKPGCAAKQIGLMVGRAKREYGEFTKFVYEKERTQAEIKLYLDRLIICRDFLSPTSGNKDELKVYKNIKREVDHWSAK